MICLIQLLQRLYGVEIAGFLLLEDDADVFGYNGGDDKYAGKAKRQKQHGGCPAADDITCKISNEGIHTYQHREDKEQDGEHDSDMDSDIGKDDKHVRGQRNLLSETEVFSSLVPMGRLICYRGSGKTTMLI